MVLYFFMHVVFSPGRAKKRHTRRKESDVYVRTGVIANEAIYNLQSHSTTLYGKEPQCSIRRRTGSCSQFLSATPTSTTPASRRSIHARSRPCTPSTKRLPTYQSASSSRKYRRSCSTCASALQR